MGFRSKFLVPGIHEIGKRYAVETGARPITVAEAWQIAEQVCEIADYDQKQEQIKSKIAALVA